MGTYLTLRLIDKSEMNIKKVNQSLTELGYPSEVFNDVLYSAFTSREQLKEDARFMNEDPKGLLQCPHFKRPITLEFLAHFFWNEIGAYVVKISSLNRNERAITSIVFKYAYENQEIIAWSRSENCDCKTLRDYGI